VATDSRDHSLDYELLDFGKGRKLERFGDLVVDRPSPAAEGYAPSRPDIWANAHAQFQRDGQKGRWLGSRSGPLIVEMANPQIQFQLDLLPSGQIGIFPEQAANWRWLYRAIRVEKVAALPGESNKPASMKLLKLFAYTGGSTLAAAAAGASVVHVDAAKSVVDRARQNAMASGLADAPIRWIVEDAAKFAEREVRRGNRYDGIILDPPTYGHGPKGEAWKIDRDLPPLLEACGDLVNHQPRLLLATAHTADWNSNDLAELVTDLILGGADRSLETGTMELESGDGRKLSAGLFARLAN